MQQGAHHNCADRQLQVKVNCQTARATVGLNQNHYEEGVSIGISQNRYDEGIKYRD